MSAKITSLIALLLFCLTLALPCMAADKAKPVPGVMEMFNNFNELEESFRGDKWDEAIATVQKIENDYKSLVKDLKGTVDGKTIQKFGFLIGSFKKSLESKDQESIEKPFVNLQTMFIDVMNYYDYPAPPVLIILARYIDEAKEALEKGDIDDAGEEMEEIGGFKDRTIAALTDKGVSPGETNNFFEMVEQGKSLAEKKDKAGFEAVLEKLATFLAPYAENKE